MKLGLEMEVEKRKLSGSSTDSQDFTSDTDATFDSSSASGSGLVLAVRDEKPFERDIPELATRPRRQTDAAAAEKIALDNNVAELWKQEPESETEDEIEWKEGADEVRSALLCQKLSYLAAEARHLLIGSIQKSGIAAWSLD